VLDVDLRLRLCQEADAAVSGTVRLDPLEVKASADESRFPLPGVQPYL